MRQRRTGLLFSAAAIAAVLVGVLAPAGQAAPTVCSIGPPTGTDFDGDRAPDVAVGVPGQYAGTSGEAGLVELRLGNGERAALRHPFPIPGDNFGRSLLPADLDGDSCTDLLVGAPFRPLEEIEAAGAVFVFRGTEAGLRPSGQLRPGTAGVPVQPESFAYFGSALGFDGTDVYVGAPGTDGPDNQVAVGAVGRMRLAFDANGQVTISGGVLLTEDTVTGGSRPEAGDEFGAALAALPRGGVAIGAPGDGAGGAVFAGRPGEDFLRLTQDTPGMPGGTEPGDGFGSALCGRDDGIIVGIPFEAIGTASAAGMITVVPTSPNGPLQPDQATGFSQNTAGVAGAAEPGDWFGSSLAACGDRVLVGSPGETVGTVVEAGMVIELGTDRGWTQNSQGVPGTARAGAHFGSAVARTFEGDSERILVGAPHTTNSRGEVVTGLLTDGPALADGTLWTLATATPNDHQEYGLAVAGS